MLSLSPRMDLFRFMLPKDFLPEEVEEKYSNILNENKSVINKPIDYLNESIQGITFPGISELNIEQDQHSTHPTSEGVIGKHINVDTNRKNISVSPANILSQIENEFTITFRKNQGLYNYFMMYETIFYKKLKQYGKRAQDDVFYIDILDERGVAVSRIKMMQPTLEGMDGLQFNYNKSERETDTFDVKFKFNNIDFDFL